MAIQNGEKAKEFNLKGVDSKNYTLESFKDKPVLGVVFSCNHCPYVIAYEDRMIEIQKKYADKGFQLVAINSNEDQNHPEDSFEKMIERAKSKGFPFPYLRDDTQQVAKAYGAAKTPHVFLFNQERSLSYTGTLDDNWEYPNKVKKQYLADAVEALLAKRQPSQTQTFPVGCTIKWRS